MDQACRLVIKYFSNLLGNAGLRIKISREEKQYSYALSICRFAD